jgi:threonine/homoserine/homoserine lactone efflux protein
MFSLDAFLTYIIITAYTPGPNNIMSMSNASRYGFRKSLPFNWGIFAGFSIVMILCTAFSRALFAWIPAIKPYMLALGAAYMLHLAWKTFRSSASIEIKDTGSNRFTSGMLLQFVNPKIYIYGITAMSSFILPRTGAPMALLGFSLFLAFVGFTGTLCWAAFGSLFYRLFSKHTKAVNTVMAVLLVYCAASLFF